MKAAVNRPWCWLIREIKHVLDTWASNSVHTGVQWSSHPLVIAGISVQRKRDSCSTPTSSRCACAVVGFRIIPPGDHSQHHRQLEAPSFLLKPRCCYPLFGGLQCPCVSRNSEGIEEKGIHSNRLWWRHQLGCTGEWHTCTSSSQGSLSPAPVRDEMMDMCVKAC